MANIHIEVAVCITVCFESADVQNFAKCVYDVSAGVTEVFCTLSVLRLNKNSQVWTLK